ncbi:MAG: HNH endonuclease [Pseudonocardia sp.]|nr:HNH endonuclease [Pseudonocardia sp.]
MSDSPLDLAHRLLTEAVDALVAAAGPGCGDAELISVLTLGEGTARRLDRVVVGALADLERRGTFAERGYRSTPTALGDLLGWDRADAKRRLTAAEQVRPRIGLDGAPLPPRLPVTAAVFDSGAASLRHVEVVARVLGSEAAGRLTPETWAGAEAQLAGWIPDCTPAELQVRGTQLVDALDADGPEPDDRPRPPVNELHLHRSPDGIGGRLSGRYDDAAMFDAIASIVDAGAKPRTAEDDRTPAQRQAEALADACGFVLDHGSAPQAPASGGRRPHLNVIVALEDLERRARAAVLDFGGTLSPESLRMLCCDAAVIPVVMNGAGQPLDVGRLTRVIPEGVRRAVAARDRGCARCGRPPSWCEIHHILAWEHHGPTCVANCVMLCRACHRLVHHAGWDVRLVDGRPEFYPPPWIDPRRRARRRPPPVAA